MTVMLSAHFTWREAACHDGTQVPVALQGNAIHLAKQVEVLRTALDDAPIEVVSWYRDPGYNANVVNAAGHSQHMLAKAMDLRVAGYAPDKVHATILYLIGKGTMEEGGLGLYMPNADRPHGWVHYDVRGHHSRWTG